MRLIGSICVPVEAGSFQIFLFCYRQLSQIYGIIKLWKVGIFQNLLFFSDRAGVAQW